MQEPSGSDRLTDVVRSRWFRRTVHLALAFLAALFCWAGVRWALRPGMFLMLDELSNLQQFLAGYGRIVHFLPQWFFGDRALGWAFIRLIFEWFGFNYVRQAECLIAVHFVNCTLFFALCLRLRASVPISIAGVALFGTLWTSANTATYIGEAPDVLCLMFLLASALALLWERRGANLLSALLYLAALRTKEFAIVAPLAFTVLVITQTPRAPIRQTLSTALRRLWPHYAVLLIFGVLYARLYAQYKASLPAASPYEVHFSIRAALDAFVSYTSLIFAGEYSWHPPAVALVIVFAAAFAVALYRRNAAVAFGISAFVLTLAPVCLIPHRATFYVYAPQVFLILAMCAVADDAIALLLKREPQRWLAAVSLTLLCFAWCLDFRRSDYFRQRINWTYGVRGTCQRTAHDIDTKLPPMGPDIHVYVIHNPAQQPWLFLTPCPYLGLVNHQRGITCIVNQPADQIRTHYAADARPKFLLDYHDDGTFNVLASSTPPPQTGKIEVSPGHPATTT